MRRFHLSTLTWYTSLLLGAAIAWLLITKNADPDLWWRLRHGSDLLTTGFTQGDPYSYTMPSFSFVSHAWSLDIVFHLLNSWGGYALLASVAILVTTIMIAVITAKHTSTYLATAAVLIFWGSTLNFMGVRAQVMAWPLFCFALWLCFLPLADWKRWRYIVPFLALFWANFHGSIPILFLLLGLKLLIDALRKSLDYWDLLILGGSLFLTLLNPYGLGLWREIWLTNTDTTLRSSITEWQPIWNRTTTTLLLFSLTAGTALSLAYLKRHFTALALLAVTALLGMMSVRHIPLFICTALFTILHVAPQFSIAPLFRDFKTDRTLRYLIRGVIGVVTLILIWAPFDPLVYQSPTTYPATAVDVLRTTYPDAVVLNHYNWGGYLIYARPEGKVFIDGRMPSWRQASTTELSNAHETWRKISKGDRAVFDQVVEQFGINTVLWLKPSTQNLGFYTMLKDAHWEVVHVDEEAVVYRAPVSLAQSLTP